MFKCFQNVVRDGRSLNIFALFRDSSEVINLLYALRTVKDIPEVYFQKKLFLPVS